MVVISSGEELREVLGGVAEGESVVVALGDNIELRGGDLYTRGEILIDLGGYSVSLYGVDVNGDGVKVKDGLVNVYSSGSYTDIFEISTGVDYRIEGDLICEDRVVYGDIEVYGSVDIVSGSVKGVIRVTDGMVMLADVDIAGSLVDVYNGMGTLVLENISGLGVKVEGDVGLSVKESTDCKVEIFGDVKDTRVLGCDGCYIKVDGRCVVVGGSLVENSIRTYVEVGMLSLGMCELVKGSKRVVVKAENVVMNSSYLVVESSNVVVNAGPIGVISPGVRGYLVGSGCELIDIQAERLATVVGASIHILDDVKGVKELSIHLGELVGGVYFNLRSVDLTGDKVLLNVGAGVLNAQSFEDGNKVDEGTIIISEMIGGVKGARIEEEYKKEYYDELGFKLGVEGPELVHGGMVPRGDGWYDEGYRLGLIGELKSEVDELLDIFVVMPWGLEQLVKGEDDGIYVVIGGDVVGVKVEEYDNKGLMVVTDKGVKKISTRRVEIG